MKDSRDVFLLLLLMRFGRKVRGRTRFQKTVYVLKNKYKLPFHFDFKSYYYGPYSEDLADTISLLQGMNLITEGMETLGGEMVRYTYRLTGKGERIADSLISKTGDKETVSRTRRYFSEIQKMPTQELIALSKKMDRSH